MFFGPLYHLLKRSDRIKALTEAYRTLKKGGLLFAVGVSRFAAFFDGVASDNLKDPEFVKIIEQDLKNGQHRNPTNNPHYFTSAFFHHPHELQAEIEEAGFKVTSLLSIEGPLWLCAHLDKIWQSTRQRKLMLVFLREVEEDPTILGASAHIMAIGKKPA